MNEFISRREAEREASKSPSFSFATCLMINFDLQLSTSKMPGSPLWKMPFTCKVETNLKNTWEWWRIDFMKLQNSQSHPMLIHCVERGTFCPPTHHKAMVIPWTLARREVQDKLSNLSTNFLSSTKNVGVSKKLKLGGVQHHWTWAATNMRSMRVQIMIAWIRQRLFTTHLLTKMALLPQI